MWNELDIETRFEALCFLPPEAIEEQDVTGLMVRIGLIRGAAIGVTDRQIKRACDGSLDDLFQLADALFCNKEAFPRFARRALLAMMVLLPFARAGNKYAVRRFIAIMVALWNGGDDPRHPCRIIMPSWDEEIFNLIPMWMTWYAACSSTQAVWPLDKSSAPTRTEKSAPLEVSDTADGADDDPTIEEIKASVRRIVQAKLDYPRQTTIQVAKDIPAAADAALAVTLRRYEVLSKPLPLGGIPDSTCLEDLDKRFPNFLEVTDGIRRELVLAAGIGANRFRLAPRILVGPPGSGKSRYARALGEALGRPVGILPAAAGEVRALIGTARGWSNATPSFPVSFMAATLRPDPVIVVDEVDKGPVEPAGASLRSALLAMIEHSTAAVWYDECLGAACDLSWIGWILTANSIDAIGEPLRDRCRILHVGPPEAASFDAYLDGILADIAAEFGVPVEALPELPSSIKAALRDGFQRNPALRPLARATRCALSALAPRTLH